jgi:zinc protease
MNVMQRRSRTEGGRQASISRADSASYERHAELVEASLPETHYRAGNWSQNADVTTQETGNLLKEIVYEIERLQKTPPTAEELKGIQNYESGLFVLRNSTPSGIIGQLNTLGLHCLPDSYLTEQVKNINDVTPQQVSETAHKYVRPEAMTIVVVGDKKIIDPQIKKFQETRKKAL